LGKADKEDDKSEGMWKNLDFCSLKLTYFGNPLASSTEYIAVVVGHRGHSVKVSNKPMTAPNNKHKQKTK